MSINEEELINLINDYFTVRDSDSSTIMRASNSQLWTVSSQLFYNTYELVHQTKKKIYIMRNNQSPNTLVYILISILLSQFSNNVTFLEGIYQLTHTNRHTYSWQEDFAHRVYPSIHFMSTPIWKFNIKVRRVFFKIQILFYILIITVQIGANMKGVFGCQAGMRMEMGLGSGSI